MSSELLPESLIQEWTESPVTRGLKKLVENELSKIEQTSVTEFLVEGNPYRTHENVVEFEARARVWREFAEYILLGDWEYFEDEESE